MLVGTSRIFPTALASLCVAALAYQPAAVYSQEPGPSASDRANPCEPFAVALEAVPHVALAVRSGRFESMWDQVEYDGCEVEFETIDSLKARTPVPSFDAIEETEMYRLGWRASHGIGADGPGSGIFGIEKDAVLCVIRWSQPAHIDDSGEIVHSEIFTMKIQCRERSEETESR